MRYPFRHRAFGYRELCVKIVNIIKDRAGFANQFIDIVFVDSFLPHDDLYRRYQNVTRSIGIPGLAG